MKSNNKLKRILILTLLISLACILSYLDRLLSSLIIPLIPVIGPFISGIKFGFANIVILFIIYHFSKIESFIGVLLKSVIIGLIYGNLTTFLIGLCGTLLSYIVMLIFKGLEKKEKDSIITSMMGGTFHMVGQLIVVFFYYGLNNFPSNVLLLMPITLLLGVLTGIIIGIIYYMINKRLKKLLEEDK